MVELRGEYPIAKYLEKNVRWVKDSISTLEKELISIIGSGELTKLSVGNFDTYQDSQNKL